MADSFRARAFERGPGTPIGAQLRLANVSRSDGRITVTIPARQLQLLGPVVSGGNMTVTVPSGDTFWDTLDNRNVPDAQKADAAAPIQAYLESLPNGSTVVWKPGVYRLDKEITQLQRHFFTHIGTGVTIRHPAHGTIRDGRITGGVHLHSPSCTFTARMVGATIEAGSTATIPAGTTITAIEDAHTVTLSQTCTNTLPTDPPITTVDINKALSTLGNFNGRNRYFFDFQLGNDFRVTGFTAIGSNPFAGQQDAAFDGRYEAQHFVVSNAADNVEVDNNTVSGIYGDYVYFTTYLGVGNNLSVGGRVHDNTFISNGRQNCSLQGVDDFRYYNNDVQQSRRSMFDMEPNGENQINRNVEIDHNAFGPHRLLFMAASGGTPHTIQEDINIHDNTSTSAYSIEWHCQPYADVATTGVLPACTYSGAGTPTLTANANGAFPNIDGQGVGQFDRVLVKNQVLTQHDGPYRLLIVGDASTPWKLQRCDDFASANTLFDGSFIYILTGTANADSGYKLHVTGTFVLGTTPQSWTHMPGTGLGTGPWAMTRKRLHFDNNTTTAVGGNSLTDCVLEMLYVSDVHATGNTQPLQNTGTVLADLNKCKGTNVVSGNTVPPGGQVRIH